MSNVGMSLERPRPEGTAVASWSWASHQSLILAIVLSLVFLILLTFTYRVVPRGFRARLVGRGVAITRSPGIQPILVRVESRVVGHRPAGLCRASRLSRPQ